MADLSRLQNQELLNLYMQNKFNPDVNAEILRRRSGGVGVPMSFTPEAQFQIAEPSPMAPAPIIGENVASQRGVSPVSNPEDVESARLLASTGGTQQAVAQPAVTIGDLSKIPQTLRLSGGSRTTTPGAYSPETAAKLADIHRQQAAAKQAEIERVENITGVSRTGETSEWVRPAPGPAGPMQPTEKSQIGYLSDTVNAYKTFKSSIEAEQKGVGEEKSKRQKQLNDTEIALQDADENLKNAKIDPDRFYSGAKGIFRGVLATIGMAFGAYAQGISGGKIPNTAASIIENAINRDMEAQKANIDILLKQRGYAKETRDYVAGRLDSSLQQWKANQLRIGELDIAQKVLAIKKPELILAASKTITDLDAAVKKSEMAAVLAMEASRPKVTTTGTSHQVINPLYTAALKQATERPKQERVLPEIITRTVSDGIELVRRIDDFVKEKKLTDPSRFTSQKYWDEGAATTLKKLTIIKDLYRKWLTGQQAPEAELKRIDSYFSPGSLTGWGPVMSLLGDVRNNAKNKVKRYRKTYEQAGKTLLEADEEALKDLSVERALKAAGLFYNQPEIKTPLSEKAWQTTKNVAGDYVRWGNLALGGPFAGLVEEVEKEIGKSAEKK